MKRILVAGVGNIFFGDDGFGVEVSRRLSERALPEGVQVRATGLLAGGPLVAGCPVAPPQPQTTARATVSMSRRIFFL